MQKRRYNIYEQLPLLGNQIEEGIVQLGNDYLGSKEATETNQILSELGTEILGNAEFKVFTDSTAIKNHSESENSISKVSGNNIGFQCF